MKTIGVLAYHGDVVEHIITTQKAIKNIKSSAHVIPVKTKNDLSKIDSLIIPGGESTVLYKLSQREGIFEDMKKISNIFGTCAGAIMLAKTIDHKTPDQKTLELMDIKVDRNAYGRQTDSFVKNISTTLGKIHAVFIRAPKITNVGNNIRVLAKNGNEIIACEQKTNGKFYMAACFHPELTTTKFHEYFLRQIN